MAEIEWRDIPGYPNYEVSRCGQVRRKPSPLRPVIDNLHGYGKVSLCDDGDVKRVFIHRLVCEIFHGPAPGKRMVVAHWNGDKLDNRAENLRWATQQENIEDARRIGTMVIGERATGAKLTAEKVAEIRELREREGLSYRAIGRRYGMAGTTIRNICVGLIWRHVNGPLAETRRRRAA